MRLLQTCLCGRPPKPRQTPILSKSSRSFAASACSPPSAWFPSASTSASDFSESRRVTAKEKPAGRKPAGAFGDEELQIDADSDVAARHLGNTRGIGHKLRV